MSATTRSRPLTSTGIAHRLAEALRPFVGGDLPVRLTAWDGSTAGPDDAPHVELRSPDALRRIVWHPGELGAAQAYVTGELEVHGDLGEALTHAFAVAEERGLGGSRPKPAALVAAVRAAAGLGVLSRPPAPPASQARMRGRLHSPLRDRRAIAHHYDLSNDFYRLLLDPAMAYSCGYWTSTDPAYGVAEAQRDKLDLVCRKLGLQPGTTLLDVGCGWGSLSLHAAERFGARVVGVTIAEEQKRFIDAQIAERGLQDRVEIRLQDYRDVPERDHYDAVGSLEMGEHVGEPHYPTYVEVLRRSVKPGGRVLVQQMSRARGRWPGGGPFIESFIAPDMHMRPVGETAAHLERGGLEVRDVHGLREHYVWTVRAWLDTFERNLPRLVELVGDEVTRVWRLYLTGGLLAFRDGRMGVDQLLCVRPGADHTLPPGPHVVTSLLVVAGTSFVVAATAMVVTVLVARRLGRVNVVDVTWGVALTLVAVACAVLSGSWQSWLLVGLTAVWGLRLSWHVLARSRGQGEDPRYEAILDGGGLRAAIWKVFVIQGAAIWLVSLPLQAAAVSTSTAWWLVALGVVVWAVGLFFEVVGDAQLASYRRQPRDARPPVMDQGLWGWTRHPNYFGDACIWWGLWLVGGLASGWLPGLLTVVAPIAMTHFLRNVTGAKLLEQTMSQRPGWAEYAARVPLFVPRPPRR